MICHALFVGLLMNFELFVFGELANMTFELFIKIELHRSQHENRVSEEGQS
jgi:hypothetical protein